MVKPRVNFTQIFVQYESTYLLNNKLIIQILKPPGLLVMHKRIIYVYVRVCVSYNIIYEKNYYKFNYKSLN